MEEAQQAVGAGVRHGGSVRVVLSNLYRHDVLDLGFDRLVKPRRHGEAYLVRYRDDFVVWCQDRADAERCQRVWVKRRATFAFPREPNKPRLVAFGRLAERKARGPGTRPETWALLGRPHSGTRHHHGEFKVGGKTDQTRLRRTLAHLQPLLQRIRHAPLNAQVVQLNQALRGH